MNKYIPKIHNSNTTHKRFFENFDSLFSNASNTQLQLLIKTLIEKITTTFNSKNKRIIDKITFKFELPLTLIFSHYL
jgi:hypothetical protein